MPKLDFIHNPVKNSLIKDGWTITDDPYIIKYGLTTLYADLGAERPIAAERAEQKIVVEAKSFIGKSKLQDLKETIGQYNIYLCLLEETAPERKLYIAITANTYEILCAQDAIQLVLNRYQLPLLVVNIDAEEIVQWIN
jgi:XisH protein